MRTVVGAIALFAIGAGIASARPEKKFGDASRLGVVVTPYGVGNLVKTFIGTYESRKRKKTITSEGITARIAVLMRDLRLLTMDEEPPPFATMSTKDLVDWYVSRIKGEEAETLRGYEKHLLPLFELVGKDNAARRANSRTMSLHEAVALAKHTVPGVRDRRRRNLITSRLAIVARKLYPSRKTAEINQIVSEWKKGPFSFPEELVRTLSASDLEALVELDTLLEGFRSGGRKGGVPPRVDREEDTALGRDFRVRPFVVFP